MNKLYIACKDLFKLAAQQFSISLSMGIAV